MIDSETTASAALTASAVTPQTVSQTVSRTISAVVLEDRPLVRAGLRRIIEEHLGGRIAAGGPVERCVALVEAHTPDVLIAIVRDDDADPFRAIAAAKALHHELHVLVIADALTVIDLREAVVAGADSFLLTSASEADIAAAIEGTARGERVVSPDVAMRLAGSWRGDDGGERHALTPRELEVLQLVAEGLTNQEVAKRLGLSARTVKTHVQNLLSKLDVPDRTGAVTRGFRLGLIR